MGPATVSPPLPTNHPHSHKDTPLRRHGCAFVLPHTPSVSHSGGLERHSGVPIKPLGVEDNPDSRVHKDARAGTYTHTHACTYNSHTKRLRTCALYCKYTRVACGDGSRTLFT